MKQAELIIEKLQSLYDELYEIRTRVNADTSIVHDVLPRTKQIVSEITDLAEQLKTFRNNKTN
jgi:hypothetical protein